jgi:hypothetical protein
MKQHQIYEDSDIQDYPPVVSNKLWKGLRTAVAIVVTVFLTLFFLLYFIP